MTEKENNHVANGYSLKKQKLKKWVYENNRSQPYVAQVMGMNEKDFKKKLNNRELFTERELRKFIYLVGAKDAFNIIYFPTLKQKQEVYQKVFGMEKDQK